MGQWYDVHIVIEEATNDELEKVKFGLSFYDYNDFMEADVKIKNNLIHIRGNEALANELEDIIFRLNSLLKKKIEAQLYADQLYESGGYEKKLVRKITY